MFFTMCRLEHNQTILNTIKEIKEFWRRLQYKLILIWNIAHFFMLGDCIQCFCLLKSNQEIFCGGENNRCFIES